MALEAMLQSFRLKLNQKELIIIHAIVKRDTWNRDMHTLRTGHTVLAQHTGRLNYCPNGMYDNAKSK